VSSIFDAVFAELHTWRQVPAVRLVSGYHEHPAYLAAIQDSIRSLWSQTGRPERLLFSFHGIPAGYAERGDPYPVQCQRTAERLAEGLGLEPQEWLLAYQSRFGPQEWLTPYTDLTLKALGRAGLRRLDVCCPGFAIDCLETLEEIAHAGRLQFQQAGGGDFHYLPALNDSPAHIAALAKIIGEQMQP
jgi:ferrochelatase